MTIIGNSLFNAGATVDTSKNGSSASFTAAIGTTYEIDLSTSSSATDIAVGFPASPTRGDAFAVVITGTGINSVSFTGKVSGLAITAKYGMSVVGQYAIFRYFDATVGWLIHSNRGDTNNTSSGYGDIAIGLNCTSSNRYSVAMGKESSSSGDFACAFGIYAEAQQGFSTAFGIYATSSGQGGCAFGYSVTASGAQKSCAFGYESAAGGDQAAAFGVGCTASGDRSLAFGKSNTSSGDRSSSFGYYNVAGGVDSSVFGYKNTTNAACINAVVVGNQNKLHSTALTSINMGICNNVTGETINQTTGAITGVINAATTQGRLTTAIGRQNNTDGNFSVAMGTLNAASGTDSVAIGHACQASGTNSTAVGRFSTASGYNAVAIGGATASGDYSFSAGYSTASESYASSFGYGGQASGGSSTAVGNYAQATGLSSSALGKNVTAAGANSTAVGKGVQTTVNDTFESGYWSNGATRGGAIRADSSGVVQFTIEDSVTPPADGGATAGSEAVGNIGRGMFTIHKNGSAVTLYYNNAGTIESVSLGTLV